MQRTATITITTPDDTQRVAAMTVSYKFDPPLGADCGPSTLADLVGYIMLQVNKVAVEGQLK